MPFRLGLNTLRAVGKKAGKVVTDELGLMYQLHEWGSPALLTLQQVHHEVVNGTPVHTVAVTLDDANSRRCLDARTRVRFSIAGPGRLIDNQGTPWGSREVELANGHARLSVRLTGPTAQLAVTAKDLPPAYLLLKNS